MAALMLLLPSLFLLAAPAVGQIRRVEIVPVPPPFIQAPPMLMNMVDMMERVVNELMPQPMVPPAAVPVIAAEMKPAEMKPAEMKPAEMKPAEMKPTEVKPAEVKPVEMKPAEVKPPEVKPSAPEAAGNKSHIEGPARPPPPLPDVAIDIKLEPLDGPELPALFPIPRIVPARAQPVLREVAIAPRKRLNATVSEHGHPHHKVAILEVSRANGSGPVLQAVAVSADKSTERKIIRTPSTPPKSAEAESSSSPKVAARLPAESAAQQMRHGTGPAAAVAASKDSAKPGTNAKQSAKPSPTAEAREDKPTDLTSLYSDSGLAAACYGIFLRHGVLILVLAVVCGVSCLVGALLPVLCKRRRGQVSQFPPKRRFPAGRIFADPAMVRMFRRRETMVA